MATEYNTNKVAGSNYYKTLTTYHHKQNEISKVVMVVVTTDISK